MEKKNDPKFEIAIFAGGCFWCTEAIFQRLTGVNRVVPGYTGGTVKNPAYREICTGKTGHAEAVKIQFDPQEISYSELLEVFFATHDPTTLNRQRNDVGPQYRSEIYYTSQGQKDVAEKFVALLDSKKVFPVPMVTTITAEKPFYDAEVEHQNYYNDNKMQPYCQFTIHPKIKKLQKHYTEKLNSATN